MLKTKRPSKNQRRCEIFDLYMDLTGKAGTGATAEEVAIFAFANGLADVPAQRDADHIHDAWEARFLAAKLRWEANHAPAT